MNFWTTDNTAEAIRLWNEGKSGDQIALVLGASSRNVVLGKLFRMGLMKNPHFCSVATRPRTRRLAIAHTTIGCVTAKARGLSGAP